MQKTCRTISAIIPLLIVAFACDISIARQSKSEESPDDSTLSPTGASADTVLHYFYEPLPMEPGSDLFQLGASFSLLSYQDAEQELPLPGLDVQYKRGIFPEVSLVGSFSTSYYSNLLHGGFQWNPEIGKFSLGLAAHLGGAYGFMKRENLFDDVEAYAIFGMFIMRFGYRFDEFSISASFVTTYVTHSRSYVNGKEASIGPENSINDYYCTLVVEQPFLKSLRLSIGFSLGYARTPYHTWMLYNTIDEWLFTPEFFFAVQL